MLVELRIAGLAVIRDARMAPGPGFTALTGETGAGKSVCLSALRLALGGRADGDPLRPGAAAARAVAVFDDVPAALRTRLDEIGVPQDDLLTLSRELPRSGRATARINGALVSQATLAEVGDGLAEITVQGASQRLLRRSWQRQLLDAFAGEAVGAARRTMAVALAAWRDAEAALEHATRVAGSDAEELARARELAAELGPLRLHPGEEAALAEEAARLRHAAGIAAAAEGIRAAAGGADENPGAADLLAVAVERARPVADLDPALRALLEEATGTVHGLRDLAAEARRCAAAVALDEGRLATVEERLDILARVRRRHGSIETALASLAGAEDLLAGAGARTADLGFLGERAEAARLEAARGARTLTHERRAAADRLAIAVTERLRRLELPHARVEVGMGTVPDPEGLDLGEGPVRCTALGVDEVELRLAADRDGDPRPLDAGPSGGELSRLALALGSVISTEDGPLLVLDEVDAGISGETAARVGDVLAAIGRQRQVIAVTHRSEIAARAGTHLVAVKHDRATGVETTIDEAAGDRRREEIARLMSGRTTDAALERAGELLAEGSRA